MDDVGGYKVVAENTLGKCEALFELTMNDEGSRTPSPFTGKKDGGSVMTAGSIELRR